MAQIQTTLEDPTVEGTTGGNATGVSARVLKKRETDRRCQRMIRERTKSRIAYLEGLVEQFRQQDSSGRVETLMKQLSDMKDDRDMLAKKVKNIENIIIDNKLKEEPDAQDFTLVKLRDESERPRSLGLDTTNHPYQRVSSPDELPSSISPETQGYALHNKEYQAYIETSSRSSWAASTLQPAPNQPCECSTNRSTLDPAKPLNLWRYANDTLTEWFKWSPGALDMSNFSAYNDDVPVRAMVEGWDAVEKQGHMHPAWRLLRGIDETMFRSMNPRERLAIMTVMGLLLQAHLNPTTEQHKKLPAYYLKRPSQDMLHSYATEYLAWPGLRERFVVSEHRYCHNIFWAIFCKDLHFQWPYEFRDCYVRNTVTGLYRISPTFHDRINDIRSWTMGMDMFKQYPELYGDIPAWNHVPASITPIMPRAGHNRRALPSKTSAQDSSNTSKPAAQGNGQRQMSDQSQDRPTTHAPGQMLPYVHTSYSRYCAPSSNHSFDSSTTAMTSYDFPSPCVTASGNETQQHLPMNTWGFNGSLDMYQLHPA